MSSSTVSPVAATTDDRTTAIISYLTLIGFIVALVLHQSKKTSLGAFHLRQSLGLMLTSIALIVVGAILGRIPYLGWLIDMTLWLGLFVVWITGLVAAIKGERKPVVLLGEYFQQWFGRAFE